ncbi:MazF family transcriptional regulator [Methylobacterium sp. J-076]|uniref:AbrB/MazE/SpoVT family DNA-binding domain-containing protein n=1 Tax=Methylobacterium sp. J-076 TaxID=2836655 RepID=UPI001FBADE44|nr:MazF family transcriptional regulator [Methylobacterium sp. J-076]MCJ2015258.1 MazF family transcriptional regulator [Methylobacterium sp. J-076]
MEAKVVRWGDDLVVRLTDSEAEELGVREGETVEIVAKRERDSERRPWAGRRYADGSPVCTLEEMVEEMRRLGPDFEPPTVEWGPDRGSEVIDDDYSR